MSERLYSVVMQRPTTIISATNQVADGVELHIEAKGGIALIVKVAEGSTPDEVDRIIRQRLSERYQIAGLGAD